MRKGIPQFALATGIAFLCTLIFTPAIAKSPYPSGKSKEAQRYVVVLEQAPLAEWHRQRLESSVKSSRVSPQGNDQRKNKRSTRLNAQSPEARDYLKTLDENFGTFRGDAGRALGREIMPRRRYRAALNGFSVELTPKEALRLAKLPQVRFVEPDRKHRLHTDAGPQWIGAEDLWQGTGSLPEARGEGIVIGIIDTGITPDHSSFSDPGGFNGTHDFINPFGAQLGLCSDPEVHCNDKVIGVYDFIVENTATEHLEHTKGIDDDGHGTHVSSIAAGNTLLLSDGTTEFTISGVAPNANIVTYRVCYQGDPDDPEDEGDCPGEAILDAIDQAVIDGVDVLNYSLGSDSISPWGSSVSLAFLNAFGNDIFVATSASNEGPGSFTIGSPGNAPWISAAGNATHNRFFGSALQNLSGGGSPPPGDIIGASLTDSIGVRDIVHAKEFGNALCGTGEPELGLTCEENTGASNPFDPGTFNGEIVVCDRGTYGFIEKSENLRLAGAGGIIVANTDETGESIVENEFCIPGIHIGDSDGDELRSWLDTGGNPRGSISASTRVLVDAVADQVAPTSSRGPNDPPDVLKPNLITPGTNILGAFNDPEFFFLSGTSMSSPHVAGAAALLLSMNDDLSPSMISSMLETTATPEMATDFDGSAADPFDRGAGRVRVDEAARAGLGLLELAENFEDANPFLGGEPRNLNLPSLTDASCDETCSFQRTVTGLVDGKSWTASATGFPEGVLVEVAPSAFNISSGGSETLAVDIDLSESGIQSSWVFGQIVLSAAGVPDAVLPVQVYSSGCELPFQWDIKSDQNSGWQDSCLRGLPEMPQATFKTAGLVAPQLDSEFLPEDPTFFDPYDGGEGVMTVWHEVPAGALWLHAETTQSTSEDIDLFVGRDTNGNGEVDEFEEVCASFTPIDLELCDILNPEAGNWWILVQNWTSGPGNNDEVFLESAVVIPDSDSPLTATGPGIIPAEEIFDLRLSWDDVNAVDGEKLLGAVSLGTHRNSPANVGVVPVYFRRDEIAQAKTLPLFDGLERRFALAGMDQHDRLFIDVPDGASKLTVAASGKNGTQNNGLGIDLQRIGFDQAFSDAPFASAAPNDSPEASASGAGGNGPVAEVSGGALQPGRWYPVVSNSNADASSVTIRADVEFSGAPVEVKGNLLVSVNRNNISQGIDYQPIGAARGLIWYTFLDNHNPAWYLSSNFTPDGNIWTGGLLRFTNDGATDQFTEVGDVAVTMLENDDAIFSWTLFGESGSERMGIVTGSDTNPCPSINEQVTSISGLWGTPVPGKGGASVLMTDAVHAEIHYLYDNFGLPFWLQVAGASGEDLVMSQFEGFCPTCDASAVSNQPVGVLGFDYMSESAAEWRFNYLLTDPLEGDVNRTDSVVKLSDVRFCD